MLDDIAKRSISLFIVKHEYTVTLNQIYVDMLMIGYGNISIFVYFLGIRNQEIFIFNTNNIWAN